MATENSSMINPFRTRMVEITFLACSWYSQVPVTKYKVLNKQQMMLI